MTPVDRSHMLQKIWVVTEISRYSAL